jgi:hypothetical protein
MINSSDREVFSIVIIFHVNLFESSTNSCKYHSRKLTYLKRVNSIISLFNAAEFRIFVK